MAGLLAQLALMMLALLLVACMGRTLPCLQSTLACTSSEAAAGWGGALMMTMMMMMMTMMSIVSNAGRRLLPPFTGKFDHSMLAVRKQGWVRQGWAG